MICNLGARGGRDTKVNGCSSGLLPGDTATMQSLLIWLDGVEKDSKSVHKEGSVDSSQLAHSPRSHYMPPAVLRADGVEMEVGRAFGHREFTVRVRRANKANHYDRRWALL